jgi:hypothetical protein
LIVSHYMDPSLAIFALLMTAFAILALLSDTLCKRRESPAHSLKETELLIHEVDLTFRTQ